MTKEARECITAGLDELEEAVFISEGAERRELCEIMQRLSTLAGYPPGHDLETVREERRLEAIEQGYGWPAPTADSLARPVSQSAR